MRLFKRNQKKKRVLRQKSTWDRILEQEFFQGTIQKRMVKTALELERKRKPNECEIKWKTSMNN